MAARVLGRSTVIVCRAVHTNCTHRLKDNTLRNRLIVAGSVTATVSLYLGKKRLLNGYEQPVSTARVYAKELGPEDVKAPIVERRVRTSYRELRFKQFASVEYDGNIFMTPQDFLESVTEETPRPRIGRHKLSLKEVDTLLNSTPPRSRGSGKLFRQILDKGIISYTEYLFLLCVLTKPQSGFKIAFNMFDTDGNQIVDKREFLVMINIFYGKFRKTDSLSEQVELQKLFGLHSAKKKGKVTQSKNDLKPLKDLVSLEEVFSSASGKTHPEQVTQEGNDLSTTNTTLLIHFFGKKGKEVLRYEDFRMFMENLQSEVLQLEFKEFSKGMPTISEVDFARILLRYTLLDRSEIDDCVERVRERIPHEKNGSGSQGISFKEFRQFCTFLNSLDDFAITMNMYALAGKPISQEDFQRAVKVCTGYTLEPHIVETVFTIFDEDGDGHLSHQEFISIMKDRLHRGSRSYLMHSQSKWEAFKTCVKNEMKAN